MAVASCPEYEVSAKGDVRVAMTGARLKHECVRNIPPRVKLYPKVGGETVRAVGALVLEAFAGAPVIPNVVPLFLDGDLSNCTLDNLRWGTHQEAEDLEATYATPDLVPRRSISDGGKGRRRRTNLTADECREIRSSSDSTGDLADRYGCSTGTIYRIQRMADVATRRRTGRRPRLGEAQVLDIVTSPEDAAVLAQRHGISVSHLNAIRRGNVSAHERVGRAPAADLCDSDGASPALATPDPAQDCAEPVDHLTATLAPATEPDLDVAATEDVSADQAQTVSSDSCHGGWRASVFLPRHLRGSRAIRRRVAYAY